MFSCAPKCTTDKRYDGYKKSSLLVTVVILTMTSSFFHSAEVAISIFEKMQAHEILRNLRLPEFDDFSQFFRSLPATTLVGIGAFAAVVAYWLASRPKAVKPPCDLLMQSEEVEVRLMLFAKNKVKCYDEY